MQTYVIERAFGSGAATAAELQAISRKSNGVLEQLGPTCQAGVRHPGATGFHLVGRNRSHVRDQQQDSPRS